jgi:hypothetical protein
MKSLYDYVQRSGLYRRTRKSDTETENSESVFEHDKGDVSSGAERADKTAKDVEVSWGDRWVVNEDEGTLTYHNVTLRKRMFVPTKSEDHVDLTKVSNVRTTKGKHVNGDEFVITDDWKQPGAQRSLANHWSGTATFYIEGKAPELHAKMVDPVKVPEPVGSTPPAFDSRKERNL